ncbi:SDR family NAD(P)-dependent oxidoreductase [Rhizobium rhizogenes]|uniref:SDR family NAD(P)-dependent oxidoreductase n=1 Tax=Rhizobium rhizogenes TaxID=359 RepID=UPI0004D99905|nr:SDR family NAD(P)-dependent oxidoreductase [Rhizobium rhizogenes]KEA04813.1 glucose 1-dehydrogenase [Rhizobium rhizogenes]NTI79144.1 SDR family NAD(P)-dependent oxidoreductase [Rhizobium rhizogenes]NTJ21245.1 SDR family NAD(P)-dependent oxidoreductase [Rhizobium rhizogenes]QUE80011.1 SDR family NAD(P)-dependent oxidoreductase [Rhizobium rhizogenes]TQO78160.1 SDR family NAD(P)-dependent oxidoreductase [Rhizobium rhizogenes]
MSTPSAVIVGVGAEQGLGAALCRLLADKGYHVVIAGRTLDKITKVADGINASGGSAGAIETDATNEAAVTRLFDHAFAPRNEIDPPDFIVFNAGINRPIGFRDVTAAEFEEFWRICCFGGFLVGREAARHLAPLGRGTVIFTGASASLRGKAGYAQFAAAKAGLRMISQSMAREFGPLGLHVAHTIIDGGIDGDRLRLRRPEIQADSLLNIDAIAETYWHIHRQHPSAWTQEIDLRPYKENF